HAAQQTSPHPVAVHLASVAGSFHKWYDACRVVPRTDEELAAVHGTRLVLDRATKTVLANGLRMLGVSAPEKM
ncbi:arginine--tRNA ligase, partial [Brevibacterium ravenspurgense]|uniref:DALR anticodon-binding domain-containing protein n=1 Tax=Brevibacterium ravenspurgense TaxID=479117 RepID=UPI0023B7FA4E